MSLTRASLVVLVRELHPDVSVEDAGVLVGLVFSNLTECLAAGYRVKLSRFGTFRVAHKSVRRGRNPQTSEEIVIPEHKVVKFRASPALIEALNE